MSDCLRLLLCSRELLAKALDRIAKEAGLGHRVIEEPYLVSVPHVSQTQPEMAFWDHKHGHRMTQRTRGDLHCSEHKVSGGSEFFQIMTTLVQVLQCLGLVHLR